MTQAMLPLAVFDLSAIFMFVLLIFGFGFVIFWHELGHFLAAKWAGVRVEAFAIGWGTAAASWRKGIGLRMFSSRDEADRRVRAHLLARSAGPVPEHPSQAIAGHASVTLSEPVHTEAPDHPTKDSTEPVKISQADYDKAMSELGISETEYRIAWLPLGGYVKMLGQDDADPTAVSEDPNAYNNKPVGKRMVIISAGVVMNIILAVILFCGLFWFGFDREPPMVGSVYSQSPASAAGLEVGDTILEINGRTQHDFSKIGLSVALLDPTATNTITFHKPGSDTPINGRLVTVSSERTNFMPGLGVTPMGTLRGIDEDLGVSEEEIALAPENFLLMPREHIVSINGQDVSAIVDEPAGYIALDKAVQTGQTVTLGVAKADGTVEQRTFRPSLAPTLSGGDVTFAGATPRPTITGIQTNSTARDKLRPGDIVLSAATRETHDPVEPISYANLMSRLAKAGANDQSLRMTVLRDGQAVDVDELVPSINVGPGRLGLGVSLGYDLEHAVVSAVEPDSPAARAGLEAGDTITAVAGENVDSWANVLQAIRDREVGPVELAVTNAAGEARTLTLGYDEALQQQLAGVRFSHPLMLQVYTTERQTNNVLIAAWWGLEETRDMVAKAYLVLMRMVERTVPANNLMGPVGVLHAGSTIAQRGLDWLVWFLAMISANLAVVNFLPLPIVDGGLFCFLLYEKLAGRPPSPKLQQAVQMVGVVLIASVFLFVTWNDIQRLVM